jgi:hypothetical protein
MLAQGIQQTGDLLNNLLSGKKISVDDIFNGLTSMGTNALNSLMTQQTT